MYLVESDALYARPKLYTGDADEHRRFLVLTRAALECCRRMNFRPHIVHSHDWHTAFAPLWLRSIYRNDPVFARHEVGDDHPQHRLPGRVRRGRRRPTSISAPTPIYCTRTTSRPGTINALKHGILHADAVTTVSPTYAREITTPRYGMGMEQALASRGSAVHGILNGVDYEEWDPAATSTCRSTSARETSSSKAELKRNFLLRQNMVPTQGRVPLFGIVSRLASQKGFDLLTDTLPKLLQTTTCAWRWWAPATRCTRSFSPVSPQKYRGRAWFFGGYDEALAHWIEGASDAFLMPSQYEPCGLNQMYSLRYGTIPIVRRTGGLADSVHALRSGHGRGHRHRVQRFRRDRDELGAGYGDEVVRATGALGTHRAERHALRFLLGNAGQRIPEAVRGATSA